MEASELIQRIQALRDKEAKSKVGLSEEDEDELGELQCQRHDEQIREIPSPQCCEAMRQFPAVYMYLPWDEKNDQYGSENPQWHLSLPEHLSRLTRGTLYRDAPEARHCPYCGKRLPKFVKRTDELPQPMMNHEAHYCRTCNERNNECVCHPHEVAWRLEDQHDDAE